MQCHGARHSQRANIIDSEARIPEIADCGDLRGQRTGTLIPDLADIGSRVDEQLKTHDLTVVGALSCDDPAYLYDSPLELRQLFIFVMRNPDSHSVGGNDQLTFESTSG